MPARRLRLKCLHVCALIALTFGCATVRAQTRNASVTLTGTVSETVALSTPPNFNQHDRDMEVVSSNGNTLRLTLSGRDSQSPVIRVPLLVRSNSGFKISAVFESQTAELARLSVIDVHPTGTFVSSHVVHDLQVTPLLNPDNAQPLLVVSGPRVSLGGTLASPNNALQLTLLIHLQAQAARDWIVHLTLVGSPESRVQ